MKLDLTKKPCKDCTEMNCDICDYKIALKLLEIRQQILDEIPDCPVHGRGCVGRALEWIAEMKWRAV